MKKIFLLMVIVFLSNTIQSQTYLDSISLKTCEYMSSKEFKKLPKKERTVKLGLFMFKMYDKFEEGLNKEGLKLDLSAGREGGRELGQKVGVNMVKFCPEALMLLANDDDSDDDDIDDDKRVFSTKGKLKSISGEEINIVSIKDDNGKTQKFIWLNNFEGSDRLINSKKVKNLKVKIYYKNIEIFSPKLKEYILRKQITKIEY